MDSGISLYLFLSSSERSSKTGAAGMLNHHSFSLLLNLVVLDFLGGEYLVDISRNTQDNKTLIGRKAIEDANKASTSTTLSVACRR